MLCSASTIRMLNPPSSGRCYDTDAAYRRMMLDVCSFKNKEQVAIHEAK
jgi:hypothetical protein